MVPVVYLPPVPAGPPDQAAVVDVLGVLAYGELTAFDRLATDARLAPTMAGRAALADMAAAELHHFRRLAGRLQELGVDPEQAEHIIDRLRHATPEEQGCSAGAVWWDGKETPTELRHSGSIARRDVSELTDQELMDMICALQPRPASRR